MKDELKEILGTIKKCIETNDDNIESFIIDINKWKELLDYITNLQEEVEDLREDNYAYHQLMKMQNKREYRSKFLKEFQKEFGTNVFPDYDEIYKRYDKLKKENERLNNIIKKTTKLLKQAGSYDEETKQFCDDVWEELPNILNTLEGSDK